MKSIRRLQPVAGINPTPRPIPDFTQTPHETHRVVFSPRNRQRAHGQQVDHPKHLPHAVRRVSPPRLYENQHRQRRERRVSREKQVSARAEIPNPVAVAHRQEQQSKTRVQGWVGERVREGPPQHLTSPV